MTAIVSLLAWQSPAFVTILFLPLLVKKRGKLEILSLMVLSMLTVGICFLICLCCLTPSLIILSNTFTKKT